MKEKKRPQESLLLKIVIAACLLVVGLAFFWQSGKMNETSDVPTINEASDVRTMMDTVVTQKVYAEGEAKAQQVMEEAYDTLAAYEKTFSFYEPASEITLINAKAGVEAAKVSPETFALLEKSLAFCARSGGLVDITIGPITSLWAVNSENPKVPTAAEIQQQLALVGWQEVVLDKALSTVFLPRVGMKLDLGAIAKGAVCNRVWDLYEKNGIVGAYLSIGGNILTYGKPGDGRLAFNVGVRNPLGSPNDLAGVLATTGEVIASSGAYERFFVEDGQSYSHIFSATTGYPMETDLAGITAITKDGAYADFLSTYLYCLGKEGVLALVVSGQTLDFEFVMVDSEGRVYLSPGIGDRFTPGADQPGLTFYPLTTGENPS